MYFSIKTQYELDKILIITIPKSGTNLIERVFGLSNYYRRKIIRTLNEENIIDINNFSRLMGKLSTGNYMTSHLHFTEDYLKIIRNNKIKTIFLNRDPRDIAVSMTHYIYKTKKHHYYTFYRDIKKFDDRLTLTINGDEERDIKPLSYHLANFTKWLDKADIVIKYEEFFSESSTLNLKFLLSLLEQLRIPDKNYLYLLEKKLISVSSPTFRKGIVGDWENSFDEETYKQFNEKCAIYLDIYGY